MSHAIYQTQALILKTKNTRESNKLVYLYTEKFGLIYANMQSLRELRAKMRYHVHPYSLVDVDLVSGRNIWRITGVHEKRSAFEIVETPWYRLISLVSDMLRRLCVGEEENNALWNDMHLLFQNMYIENKIHVDSYEHIIMVRILYHLGYWSGHDMVIDTKNPYELNVYMHIQKNRLSYVQKINQALHDSQL